MGEPNFNQSGEITQPNLGKPENKFWINSKGEKIIAEKGKVPTLVDVFNHRYQQYEQKMKKLYEKAELAKQNPNDPEKQLTQREFLQLFKFENTKAGKREVLDKNKKIISLPLIDPNSPDPSNPLKIESQEGPAADGLIDFLKTEITPTQKDIQKVIEDLTFLDQNTEDFNKLHADKVKDPKFYKARLDFEAHAISEFRARMGLSPDKNLDWELAERILSERKELTFKVERNEPQKVEVIQAKEIPKVEKLTKSDVRKVFQESFAEYSKSMERLLKEPDPGRLTADERKRIEDYQETKKAWEDLQNNKRKEITWKDKRGIDHKTTQNIPIGGMIENLRDEIVNLQLKVNEIGSKDGKELDRLKKQIKKHEKNLSILEESSIPASRVKGSEKYTVTNPNDPQEHLNILLKNQRALKGKKVLILSEEDTAVKTAEKRSAASKRVKPAPSGQGVGLPAPITSDAARQQLEDISGKPPSTTESSEDLPPTVETGKPAPMPEVPELKTLAKKIRVSFVADDVTSEQNVAQVAQHLRAGDKPTFTGKDKWLMPLLHPVTYIKNAIQNTYLDNSFDHRETLFVMQMTQVGRKLAGLDASVSLNLKKEVVQEAKNKGKEIVKKATGWQGFKFGVRNFFASFLAPVQTAEMQQALQWFDQNGKQMIEQSKQISIASQTSLADRFSLEGKDENIISEKLGEKRYSLNTLIIDPTLQQTIQGQLKDFVKVYATTNLSDEDFIKKVNLYYHSDILKKIPPEKVKEIDGLQISQNLLRVAQEMKREPDVGRDEKKTLYQRYQDEKAWDDLELDIVVGKGRAEAVRGDIELSRSERNLLRLIQKRDYRTDPNVKAGAIYDETAINSQLGYTALYTASFLTGYGIGAAKFGRGTILKFFHFNPLITGIAATGLTAAAREGAIGSYKGKLYGLGGRTAKEYEQISRETAQGREAIAGANRRKEFESALMQQKSATELTEAINSFVNKEGELNEQDRKSLVMAIAHVKARMKLTDTSSIKEKGLLKVRMTQNLIGYTEDKRTEEFTQLTSSILQGLNRLGDSPEALDLDRAQSLMEAQLTVGSARQKVEMEVAQRLKINSAEAHELTDKYLETLNLHIGEDEKNVSMNRAANNLAKLSWKRFGTSLATTAIAAPILGLEAKLLYEGAANVFGTGVDIGQTIVTGEPAGIIKDVTTWKQDWDNVMDGEIPMKIDSTTGQVVSDLSPLEATLIKVENYFEPPILEKGHDVNIDGVTVRLPEHWEYRPVDLVGNDGVSDHDVIVDLREREVIVDLTGLTVYAKDTDGDGVQELVAYDKSGQTVTDFFESHGVNVKVGPVVTQTDIGTREMGETKESVHVVEQTETIAAFGPEGIFTNHSTEIGGGGSLGREWVSTLKDYKNPLYMWKDAEGNPVVDFTGMAGSEYKNTGVDINHPVGVDNFLGKLQERTGEAVGPGEHFGVVFSTANAHEGIAVVDGDNNGLIELKEGSADYSMKWDGAHYVKTQLDLEDLGKSLAANDEWNNLPPGRVYLENKELVNMDGLSQVNLLAPGQSGYGTIEVAKFGDNMTEDFNGVHPTLKVYSTVRGTGSLHDVVETEQVEVRDDDDAGERIPVEVEKKTTTFILEPSNKDETGEGSLDLDLRKIGKEISEGVGEWVDRNEGAIPLIPIVSRQNIEQSIGAAVAVARSATAEQPPAGGIDTEKDKKEKARWLAAQRELEQDLQKVKEDPTKKADFKDKWGVSSTDAEEDKKRTTDAYYVISHFGKDVKDKYEAEALKEESIEDQAFMQSMAQILDQNKTEMANVAQKIETENLDDSTPEGRTEIAEIVETESGKKIKKENFIHYLEIQNKIKQKAIERRAAEEKQMTEQVKKWETEPVESAESSVKPPQEDEEKKSDEVLKKEYFDRKNKALSDLADVKNNTMGIKEFEDKWGIQGQFEILSKANDDPRSFVKSIFIARELKRRFGRDQQDLVESQIVEQLPNERKNAYIKVEELFNNNQNTFNSAITKYKEEVRKRGESLTSIERELIYTKTFLEFFKDELSEQEILEHDRVSGLIMEANVKKQVEIMSELNGKIDQWEAESAESSVTPPKVDKEKLKEKIRIVNRDVFEKAGKRSKEEMTKLVDEVSKAHYEMLVQGKGKIGNTIDETEKKGYEKIVCEGFVTYIPKGAGELVVVGDLHGDFAAFEKIINKNQFVENMESDSPSKVIVFEGDYLDRGEKDVQLMEALLELKKRYPNNVVLMKADHEVRKGVVSDQTYFDKTKKQYGDETVFDELNNKIFSILPRAVFCGNGVVMAHGGPLYYDLDLRQMASLRDSGGNNVATSAFDEVMTWADPQPMTDAEIDLIQKESLKYIEELDKAIPLAQAASDKTIDFRGQKWDLDHLERIKKRIETAPKNGFWFNPRRVNVKGRKADVIDAALNNTVIYSEQGLEYFLNKVGGKVLIRGHQVTEKVNGGNPFSKNILWTIHSTGEGSPDSAYTSQDMSEELNPSYAVFDRNADVALIDPAKNIVPVWN